MQNSKGSLILTALSSTVNEPRLIAYLAKRAKTIPPERIPSLLHNLPVVLSRNITEEISLPVIRKLNELGARARFVPLPNDTAAEAPLPAPDKPAEPVRSKRPFTLPKPAIKLPSFHWHIGPLTNYSLRQSSKNLLIIIAMLAAAWALDYTIAPQSQFLSVFILPAVAAAYFFGRNWSLLTACASILLAGLTCLLTLENANQLNLTGSGNDNPWLLFLSWGSVLLTTAFAMGTLHEKSRNQARELRQTHQGLLLILRQVAIHDEERENHCFRVSIYATRIAAYLEVDKNSIKDIRTAALMHDLGRTRLSRSILRKASSQWHIQDEAAAEETGGGTDERLLSGPVGRILPLLLGSHEQTAVQAGEQEKKPEKNVPLGTRILVVADAYDTLTAGNHEQKAISPAEARAAIVAKAGTEFDLEVVKAFTTAFDRMELELPAFIL